MAGSNAAGDMTDPIRKAERHGGAAARSRTRAFFLVAGLGALLIPAAVAMAHAMSIDLKPPFKFDIADVFVGLVAVAPLAALLRWFMKTAWPPLAGFRESQLKFFAEIGFRLSRPRIFTLAIIAGIGEELIFRGVLQEVIDRRFGIVAAILLTNLVFGLLHARTPLYAAIAAMVGGYFSLLYAATGSLIAPIIAHAVYDFIAFDWTRIALDRRDAISPAAQNRALPQ